MGITGVAVVASLPVTRDPKASAQSSTSAIAERAGVLPAMSPRRSATATT
jgi:hypothetical protein